MRTRETTKTKTTLSTKRVFVFFVFKNRKQFLKTLNKHAQNISPISFSFLKNWRHQSPKRFETLAAIISTLDPCNYHCRQRCCRHVNILKGARSLAPVIVVVNIPVFLIIAIFLFFGIETFTSASFLVVGNLVFHGLLVQVLLHHLD